MKSLTLIFVGFSLIANGHGGGGLLCLFVAFFGGRD